MPTPTSPNRALPRTAPHVTALFFVGFDFSTDGVRDVERFWKQSKRLIKLLRVQEIDPPSPASVSLRSALEEEVARKMA